MADIPLSSGVVPAGTPYPGNFQDFLDVASSYLTVEYPDNLRSAVVSSSTPTGSDLDKIWFRLSSTDGTPTTVNLYINGAWTEFTQFNFGDMVLIAESSVIVNPWGTGGTAYTLSGQKVVTPATPTSLPAGFKYKVYVGNYS
jgi:hypothetical protein